MGNITVRTRSLVWFALGAVTMLIATAVWMSAWSADAAPGDSDTTVVPITSCRLTDTRPNFQVGPRDTPLGAEETYPVEVQNASTDCVGKVPASATGLLLNVTAVQTTQPTFLSIWDQGPFPGTSSLNPVPGPPVPNAVTTKLADDDTFRVYNLAGTTHVIIDIVGYLTPISLTEIDQRLDTLAAANAETPTIIGGASAADPTVFAFGDGAKTVNSISFVAPAAGKVVVDASGTASDRTPDEIYFCGLGQDGSVSSPTAAWEPAAYDFDVTSAVSGTIGQLSLSRVFTVAAGEQTINMNCETARQRDDGLDGSVSNTTMTYVFVAD